MTQLHTKDRGLYLIQPAIPARLTADVFFRLSVIPQNAQMRGAVGRIGYDHACIAARAEIFRRIKAKARDITERPGAPALVAGADGLRGVFDNWNILFSREFHDRVHVRA